MAAIPNLNTFSLKRLEKKDFMSFFDSDENPIIITKQETRSVVREYIDNEFARLISELTSYENPVINELLTKTLVEFDEKLVSIEKQIGAYIDHRIDNMVEVMVERLINRKFEEEVNRRVERELKRKKGGKF